MSNSERRVKKRAGPLRRGCARAVRALARWIIPCYGASRRRETSAEELRDVQVSPREDDVPYSSGDDRATVSSTGDGQTEREAIRTATLAMAAAIAAGRSVDCYWTTAVRPQMIGCVARTRCIHWSDPGRFGPRSHLLADASTQVESADAGDSAERPRQEIQVIRV